MEKLHTMNLVAAGSPLTDMGFVEFSVQNMVGNLYHFCFPRLFPSLPSSGGKLPCDFNLFRSACGTGLDSRNISGLGPTAH